MAQPSGVPPVQVDAWHVLVWVVVPNEEDVVTQHVSPAAHRLFAPPCGQSTPGEPPSGAASPPGIPSLAPSSPEPEGDASSVVPPPSCLGKGSWAVAS